MTRKFASVSLLFAVVLSLTALAQTGNAASAPAVTPSGNKIGIINIQGAILSSNEGRRDLEALDKKFEPKRNELQTLNKEITDLKKQLDTQGDKLNDDARNNLVKNLDSKQKQFNRSAEDAQNDYQQQQNEIAQQILRKMAPLIDKFAKDNQFALLIDVSQPWPQGQVLWFGPSVDVTKQIVDLYNSQSGVPAPAAPAASSSRPAAPGASRTTGTTPAQHKPPSAPPKSQ